MQLRRISLRPERLLGKSDGEDYVIKEDNCKFVDTTPEGFHEGDVKFSQSALFIKRGNAGAYWKSLYKLFESTLPKLAEQREIKKEEDIPLWVKVGAAKQEYKAL